MSDPPFDPTVPFRSSAAVVAGISRRRLAGPAFVRLFHDTYVQTGVELTPAVRAAAALVRSGPTARCSHFTAARLAGLPVPERADEWVTVASERERTHVPGLECRVAVEEPMVFAGLPITPPGRIFVDLAPLLSLVELVIVGDALVRAHLSLDELTAYVAGARGAGAREARRAVGFVRERVDSPMETRVRMLIVLAGLPEPEVNIEVVDASGAVRRLDLVYNAIKLVIEYDGKGHKVNDAKWAADLGRREDLERLGFSFVTVVARDVFNHPDRTVARITTALSERGLRVRPRDEWRRHFVVTGR